MKLNIALPSMALHLGVLLLPLPVMTGVLSLPAMAGSLPAMAGTLPAMAGTLPAMAEGGGHNVTGMSEATPQGYVARALEFHDGGIWKGVVDQLELLRQSGGLATLDAPVREEALFLLAEACRESCDPRATTLLAAFRNEYPSSFLAPRATMLLGDGFFFSHDWAGTVEAYREVDAARLPSDMRPLYAYRYGLSLIKTGYFAEARPQIRSLGKYKDYRAPYDFYMAYLDYMQGDFRRAYSGFSRVPEGIDGLDAGYYMTQIEYSRGDYGNASRRGLALLKGKVPADLRPELERVTGLALFKSGESGRARPLLERYLAAAGARPEDDALYALGVCDYEDGDIEGAAERFQTLTTLDSEIGQSAWLYLGQCRLREGDAREAAVDFGKAARMDLDREVTRTAWYNYVAAATRSGGEPFSSAASKLEEFVTRFPDSPYSSDVERYLATAYFNERNYSAALRSVEGIRKPTPEVTLLRQKILYELGVEALSNGRPSAAADWLGKCAAIRSTDPQLAAEASLWLGDALYALKRYKEAGKAYSTFLSGAPTSANRALGLYNRGYASYKQGAYRDAARDFASASDGTALDSRRRTDAMLRRADCLYYSGDYSAAGVLYRGVVDAGEGEEDYALWRGAVVAGLTGQDAEKVKLLLRLEREHPSSRWLTKGLQELALTYENQGKMAEAADVYRRRLAAGSGADTDELMRMSETMHRAGRWEDLLSVADKLSSADGLGAEDLAELDLRRADALLNLRRGREAREIYTRLAANPSSLTGAKAAVALGEELLRNREYGEAEKRLLEFTDAGTPHAYWLARGFIALADTYAATGRESLAKEYLETLRENYPGEGDDIESRISASLRKIKK